MRTVRVTVSAERRIEVAMGLQLQSHHLMNYKSDVIAAHFGVATLSMLW